MAEHFVSMESLRFLLHETHDLKSILGRERFQDFDEETVDIMLDAAKDFADKELFPYFVEMDQKPAYYEDGKIITHPHLRNIIQMAAENGWIGAVFDADHGGMQLPRMVNSALMNVLYSANNHAMGYIELTNGSSELIAHFGSKELREYYVPKMHSGKWTGTMALTEPQAGSSLSDITTSAKPNEDGSYDIKGQKIFISGGDNDFSENIVHLTLARIEGAPAGTKGISLFVVPKKRQGENGELVANDVTTAADFPKLGQRGYVTAHLVMGENDNCKGWLVGEPHKGLKYMFQMMNEARVSVGICAASTASGAYYAALQYAQERPQGRKLTQAGDKDLNIDQTLIINHPDVRRMLFLQKAIIDGSMSLAMECSRLGDLIYSSEGEEQQTYKDLLEVLTPIVKTFPAEMGQVAISNALQVLGGYGYCMDFPLQQYYRDIRIMSIYEGTTGIQSIDLLGRKVTMKGGRALQLLVAEMSKTIAASAEIERLKPYGEKLAQQLMTTQEVLGHLMRYAMKGDFQNYLADANMFMDMASTIVIAWQWLKQGIAAHQTLESENKRFSDTFYESRLHLMKFWFKYQVPKIKGLAKVLLSKERLTLVGEKEYLM